MTWNVLFKNGVWEDHQASQIPQGAVCPPSHPRAFVPVSGECAGLELCTGKAHSRRFSASHTLLLFQAKIVTIPISQGGDDFVS